MEFPELWMRMVCGGSVRSVLSLYLPDAVLVPTYNQDVLQGHTQLRAYFRRFMSKDNLCGHVDGMVIQNRGGLRIISGIYTFRWTENGREESVKARFTFVLVSEDIRTGRVWSSDTRWRVLTHHSSEVPAGG